MREPQLLFVPIEDIDRYWFMVEHKLGKAIQYSDGKYSLKNVYQAIKNQTMQLWLIKITYDLLGVCITEIIDYPDKKVCSILFVGGENFDTYKQLMDRIVLFARRHDCESIEVYGRHGWKKKLAEFGFEHLHSVFRMPLDRTH